MQRTAVVHTSILAPPRAVTEFLADVENWKSWAPWVQSTTRRSAREWHLETADGPMELRFVAPNDLGVLDHEVRLASGVTQLNSMRVLPNGDGSELVMVWFQAPGVSSEAFARDVQAVTDDLARIKTAAETFARQARR